VLQQEQQDPLYKATKRHFAHMFSKFSFPIYCFNLTKEFNNREMIVANEYNKAVNQIINPELPKPLKLRWVHYDVKAKKKEEKNFPFGLFGMAEDIIKKIQFF
jgi:hypothetical protein